MGDVGGLMEVVYSFFRILSSFIVGILYDESLVNNLFTFDLEQKVITLKNKNKNKSLDERKNGYKKILKESEVLRSETKKEDKNNNIVIKFKKKKNKSNLENDKNESGNKSLNSNVIIYGLNNKNENDKLSNNSNRNEKLNKVHKNFNNLNFHLDKNNENVNNLNESLENKDEHRIIEKVTINKFLVHLCFCCIRSTKNLKNFLLDEGMNIIMEELEIFNVFKKLYTREKINYDYKIEFSDKLEKQLNELYKERIFDVNS